MPCRPTAANSTFAAQSSLTITATADEPETVHAARRTALAAAVRASFCR